MERTMKRLVVYVINVDEDVAEKAFDNAVEATSLLPFIDIKKNSISIEPHDDYRGIVASFDYQLSIPDPQDSNMKKASIAVHETVQTIIKTNLWSISAARVMTEAGTL
jgi:hypothetical protein